MGNLLASGSVVAAFFAGGVALFAPCCIVFLAPGYLALAARNHRWRLLPLTFAFTAGLALVLVPITLGISLVAASIARFHAPLYYAGGTLMLALAALALSGRMWSMPRFLPDPDAGRGDSASFFAFGVFSGIASSCCAPVLAGVMTLSALSGTPGGGIVLGLAYVFGMTFPLLVMALAWDKLHLSERRLLRARAVRLHLAGRTLVTSTVNIAVAAGFAAMAGFVFYLAGAGRMTGGPGFQVAIGRVLSRVFRRIEIWTAPVPEAVLGLALLALAAVFVVAALRGRRPDLDPHPDPDPDPATGVAGQPPAPADGETSAANPALGSGGAADHHCHAPVRNQSLLPHATSTRGAPCRPNVPARPPRPGAARAAAATVTAVPAPGVLLPAVPGTAATVPAARAGGPAPGSSSSRRKGGVRPASWLAAPWSCGRPRSWSSPG